VYSGHQTDVAEDPGRADNLFAPVEGDHGARGPFNDRVRSTAPQFWMNKHRGLVIAGLLGLGAGIVFAASERGRKR
jgi:hypothetical protein